MALSCKCIDVDFSRAWLTGRSISPSVYVAYHNLRATEECWFALDKFITRGSVYNPTIAYPLESLSMRLCPGPKVALDGVTSWPPFYDSNNITALQYGTKCYMGEYWGEGGFFTSWEDSNPNTAVYSLPKDLSLIDPEWEVCSVNYYGALDPPRALIKPTAPVGLVPASVPVHSPTATDQYGPQETLAKPVPTFNTPPMQTQPGNQPPTPGSNPSPSEPVDPALGSQPATVSPGAISGDQDVSPDLPAPENAGIRKDSAGSKVNQPDKNQNTSPESSGPATDPAAQSNVIPADLKQASDPLQHDSGLDQSPSLISVLSVGGHTFTALPAGGFLVAATSIEREGPAITAQGTRISLGSSALIVGSSTMFLPTASANGVLTAAGIEFTPLAHGKVRLNGKTLSVDGSPLTTSGTVISLAPSGIAIAGQTFVFPTPIPNARVTQDDRILTIAGHKIIRLDDSKAIVDGVELTVNNPVQTVSGTPLSLASSNLVINGQTYTFPTPPPATPSSPNRILTTAGQTVTLLDTSAAIVDGTVLSIGGPAKTLSGTTLSLAPAALIINGQNYRFTTTHTTPPPALALNTLTNAILIDGTTLSAGAPALTLSGTTLTLVSGTAGLYLSALGPSTLSMPVTAGESMTVSPTGQLLIEEEEEEEGGSVDQEEEFGGKGRSKDGALLGSWIMRGFRSPGTSTTTSPSDEGKNTTVGKNLTDDNNAIPATAFEAYGVKSSPPTLPSLTAFTLIVSYILALPQY